MTSFRPISTLTIPPNLNFNNIQTRPELRQKQIIKNLATLGFGVVVEKTRGGTGGEGTVARIGEGLGEGVIGYVVGG